MFWGGTQRVQVDTYIGSSLHADIDEIQIVSENVKYRGNRTTAYICFKIDSGGKRLPNFRCCSHRSLFMTGRYFRTIREKRLVGPCFFVLLSACRLSTNVTKPLFIYKNTSSTQGYSAPLLINNYGISTMRKKNVTRGILSLCYLYYL